MYLISSGRIKIIKKRNKIHDNNPSGNNIGIFISAIMSQFIRQIKTMHLQNLVNNLGFTC